jgi:hypothetical protein
MRPQTKQSIAIAQVSTTNAATATGNVDTLGFDYLSLDVIMATSDDTTNNPTVFKLSESDTTDATNYSDITAFVGDTAWTIPIAATSGNWGVKFNVNLVGKKRHIKLSISPLTTQVITAIGNLSLGDDSASSATIAGVDALVQG